MTSLLIAGATGLVGGECVGQALADPEISRVVALVRRPLPAARAHPKLVERVVDFERLEDSADAFATGAALCALGTTIRQAGSQAAFRRVDHDYVLAVARLARAAGARHFLLVSSLGADAGSRVFYSRVKGEVEAGVRALGFEALTIARPSLLLGERAGFRLGEEVAKRFAWAMPGRLKPIEARTVARALLAEARDGSRVGDKVLESEEMRRRAEEMGRG